MTNRPEPVYEALGQGRARLTLMTDSGNGSLVSEITWFDQADGTRVIDHTRVPDVLSGQGIAAKLTLAAVRLARHDRAKIIPQCSYVARWLKQHPEWHDDVTGQPKT